MSPTLDTRLVHLTELTQEAFAPFGTVIVPMEDGTPFDDSDAQLDLSAGTPRFYAMKLTGSGKEFSRITRHRQVTQTLASVGGHDWAIAVAPPLDPGNPDAVPNLEDIVAFRIPGDVAIMLHKATWHAGPLLAEGERQDFFNLELADTNAVDHQNFHIDRAHGITMRVVE